MGCGPSILETVQTILREDPIQIIPRQKDLVFEGTVVPNKRVGINPNVRVQGGQVTDVCMTSCDLPLGAEVSLLHDNTVLERDKSTFVKMVDVGDIFVVISNCHTPTKFKIVLSVVYV